MAQVMFSLVQLIFVGSFLRNFVASIEAEFLWNVINATIPDYKTPCPRVVLYSQDNEGLVHRNFTGSETILININEDEKEQVKEQVKNVETAFQKNLNFSGLARAHPCIIVISIVNASESSDSTVSSYAEENDQQAYKRNMSHRLVDLLQFNTPMRCRKLFLVRLAESRQDLYFCSKAAKYPRRLVPMWEQILFDFFTKVKVIQGLISDDERVKQELKVTEEPGKWLWLCEDVIKRLEEEEKCQSDNTAQCKEDEKNGEFSNLNKTCTSEKYKPRQ